jgi:glycosyltransferase involved in cell wall biosynthesis
MKISGIIITFNEEKRIESCIRSLLTVCDEVVVLDSFSTDKTESICRAQGVKFYQQPFLGYIEQKNAALELAQFEWVLSLDGDECLSDEAIAKIKDIKTNGPKADGYTLNRLNNYCGQWIWHCGWYPDRKLRLVKRDEFRWGGKNPHDLLMPIKEESVVAKIDAHFLHYSYDTIAEHIEQTNRFTTLSAVEFYNSGRRVGSLYSFVRGFLQFFRDYILKRGFLDGRYGLVVCLINALATFLKFEKIYQLQLKQNDQS